MPKREYCSVLEDVLHLNCILELLKYGAAIEAAVHLRDVSHFKAESLEADLLQKMAA